MADEFPPQGASVDLFGNEILPMRDRRGRPSFKKTKENQDFVAVRAAAGWNQDLIAEALGCDPKTLRKNFSRELSQGALLIDGLCLDVLLRGAREGHTPSVKALQARLDRVSAGAPRAAGKEKNEQPAKAEKLGVKEKRLNDATKPQADYGSLYDRIPRQ